MFYAARCSRQNPRVLPATELVNWLLTPPQHPSAPRHEVDHAGPATAISVLGTLRGGK
jgi:hypothetical protein